jgi:hypothetical protein
MSDIVFMDTETLGLHPDAPVWEFAAIRRAAAGQQQDYHCFIDHNPSPWLYDMPAEFRADYEKRYGVQAARGGGSASALIFDATQGAHVVGAVPNFDTERLSKLLWRNLRLPNPWHYHLIDVENLIVGYLRACRTPRYPRRSAEFTELTEPPWKSDDLSRAVGVDPEQFDRHTAMGDVLWVKAQYDAVMGGVA